MTTLVSVFTPCLIFLAAFPLVPSSAFGEEFDPSTEFEQARGGSAIVYLIDKSSSMLWVFDELKGIVKKAIDQRGPEESTCIIVFGDSVTTLASYKHLDDSNKAALSGLLDSVYADALYTNLEFAIDRGTQHLYTYFCDHMAENYTLILVTDGKNHPPPGHIRERSLEEAVTQFSDFLPGKQWSLGYVVFGGSDRSGTAGPFGEIRRKSPGCR